MATQCFLVGTGNDNDVHMERGTNTAKLNGSTSGWEAQKIRTARGIGVNTYVSNTVTGPTAGIEAGQVSAGVPIEFISDPLDAGVTISGTITLNLWAAESNMSANVAINCKIERIDSVGAIISTVATTARTTEVAITTPAANNFTVTPTSTNFLKGDRIRIVVFGDDAGTMATGYTFTFTFQGTTAGANGDSYVTFTENFGFQAPAATPAGSKLFLTDTAGPAVGANIEREMWTAIGAGVQTDVVNTAAGWTAPIQLTDTAGGTAVEWYSKPLTAFTLTGIVKANIWAITSAFASNCQLRCEIAVCNEDGSGAVVWGATTTYYGSFTGAVQIWTSDSAFAVVVAGNDVSVTDRQRLRLRVFIDDRDTTAMGSGQTVTVSYAGVTGGASGDSYITLTQTVFEAVAAPPRYPAIDHCNPALV